MSKYTAAYFALAAAFAPGAPERPKRYKGKALLIERSSKRGRRRRARKYWNYNHRSVK